MKWKCMKAFWNHFHVLVQTLDRLTSLGQPIDISLCHTRTQANAHTDHHLASSQGNLDRTGNNRLHLLLTQVCGKALWNWWNLRPKVKVLHAFLVKAPSKRHAVSVQAKQHIYQSTSNTERPPPRTVYPAICKQGPIGRYTSDYWVGKLRLSQQQCNRPRAKK